MAASRKWQRCTQPSIIVAPSTSANRGGRNSVQPYVVENRNRNRDTSKPKANVTLSYRIQAVGDIKRAEKDYVHRLELVIKHFVRPLKRLLNDDACHSKIFGQFVAIHSASKEFLHKLKTNMHGIGLAFAHFTPILNLYGCYASSLKDVMLLLEEMTRRNFPLRRFIERKEADPEVQCSLNYLLQTPIHRLSRLKAQVDQLLIHTHIEHEDYDPLHETSSNAGHTLLNLNFHIEQQRLLQMLINVQYSLLDLEPQIVQPFRFVVKEGMVLKDVGGGRFKKRYCVLMSDILMYCKIKRKRVPNKLVPNSLECCSIFPLTKCQLTEIMPFNFKVCCEDKIATFRASNRYLARTWVSFIRNGITMCRMSSGSVLHDHKKSQHIMVASKRYVCSQDYMMPFSTDCLTDSESDTDSDATPVGQTRNIRRRERVTSTPIKTVFSPVGLNMTVAKCISPDISSITIGTDHDYASSSSLSTVEPFLVEDLSDECLYSGIQNHWSMPVELDAPPPPSHGRYGDPFDEDPIAHMSSHELNLIQDHPLFVLKDLMTAPHSSTREIVYDFFYQVTQIL